MDPTPGRFEIEKFDGERDFRLWKLKILAQLEIQGLLSVLNKEPKSSKDSAKIEDGTEVKKDSRKSERDLQAKSLFSTCLSDVNLR